MIMLLKESLFVQSPVGLQPEQGAGAESGMTATVGRCFTGCQKNQEVMRSLSVCLLSHTAAVSSL